MAEKRPSMVKKIISARFSYAFLAPFTVMFFLFTVLPVLSSIGFSFTYYSVLEPPNFIGWNNYIGLFFDDVFRKSVINTIILGTITSLSSFFISFLIAWLINELKPVFRTALMVVFYAPVLSGQMYMLWGLVFSSDMYGYANGMLIKLGLITDPILWLSDTKYIMPTVIAVLVWMSFGTGFLAFVAGLQTLPRNLYEASAVDGIRNRWQELWFITLPQLKPIMMYSAIMSITSSFAIHDQIAPLAGFPSVDYSVHTIVSHLVDYGTIRFNMGYASAIATLLFLFMLGANGLARFLIDRVGQ